MVDTGTKDSGQQDLLLCPRHDKAANLREYGIKDDLIQQYRGEKKVLSHALTGLSIKRK